jgi:hypothetical protein
VNGLGIRNQAKYESLKYIDGVGFASSAEIAEYRGVTHGCQSTLLRRYWRDGLLQRCSGEGKEKIYTMSSRGDERLEWLVEQFEGIYEDEFTEILANVKRCRVRRDNEIEDFLKNVKRCRIVKIEDVYIEIERT